MGSSDLLTICAVAFTTVFLLLSSLAIIMKLIITVFKEKDILDETTIYAAISAVFSAHHPGKRIKKIEELK